MLKRFLWLVGGGVLVLRALGTPVIDYGTDWRYFVGATEASSPDTTAWRQASFDDSAWSSSVAPIGYANPANSTPEYGLVTLLPSSQEGNYLSLFLRKQFQVANPAYVTQLTLNVNVDDGFIAWINGVEVARYNVPSGAPDISWGASSAIEPTLVTTPVTNTIASLLQSGLNVVAVQVFNANSTSSDLFFDAALESDLDETPPVMSDTVPVPGTQVTELTSIDVSFSENVQGVDASDLWINGTPATGLNVVSPREYVFSFPQPADGLVLVEFAPDHGIRDLSPAGNAFGGGRWNYGLDSPIPPTTVMISEFLADNSNGIKDDDGHRSDWIELFNYGSEDVDLAGWFLTDEPTNLTKWRLPQYLLSADSYLLIWASGLNRTNPAAPLHTNFKLDKGGDYLALVDPQTNVISEFAPTYPPQQSDVSYGRDAADPSITGFFTTPTPGTPNPTSGPGFAPEPVFGLAEGVYTNASLVLTLSAPSGQIRYTLDGSVPTSNSTLYLSSRTITVSLTVKARVFQTGLLPSAVVARNYLLVDSTVAGFTSKLPLLIISTTGKSIVDHPAPGTTRTFAAMAAIDTVRGLSSPLAKPDYFGQGGISIRGQTSSSFPKKPYRLELEDACRFNRNAALLGLPSGNDWVLNNPYTDKPFLQNFLAYELFEKMGHYSVRRRFVEVFLNTSSSRMTYSRDYAGIYLLLEKIQVDKNRVNLQPLTPYDTTEPDISGGYMFKKDKDTSGDLNFTTSGGAGFSAQTLKIHEPKPREISTSQLNWLVSYLKRFESALYASNWKTATGTNHYSSYIDVDSLVDNHWIVEFTKQIDGYRLSNYMQKDRNGKIKMEPIWDYNLSFGNADYLDGWVTSGWYYSLIGENEHIWLRRLMCGTTSAGGTTGDPDFNQRIADRWSVLRTNVLAATNVLARVDELAALLNEAAARDFAKWPRLGTYVWPNPTMYVTPTTYAGIISAMKTWIQGRYSWIDSQFIVPPRFNVPAGRVPAGLNLTLTGTGIIYYTVDGSDPRLSGGSVSSLARRYTSAFPLTTNTHVIARSLSGTKWSGPAAATFLVQPLSLLLTEILYHPAPPPAGSPFDEEDFEYLEFKNAGGTAIQLQGFQITDGVYFVFPAYTLNPGARVLVVKNRAAVESRYGTGLPVVGEYTGQLNNAGERITVTDPWLRTLFSFSYDPAWYPITDGPGFALVLADEGASSSQWSSQASWCPGSLANGTPGYSEPGTKESPPVVVSEALTCPASGPAIVELQNLSPMPADIGGWFLTDNFSKPVKFRIPSPTLVPAGGFVTFNGNDFKSANALVTFTLDPLGEEIFLFSSDTATNLTGYVHGFTYGSQKTNVAFGRYVNSVGAEYFVAQSANTLGGTNAGPAIPPVVLSEVMYHPPDLLLNGAWWNDTEDEYVELYNRSGGTVPLYDAARPTNGWKVTGQADFTFPSGTSLGPGAYLLLVNFDPALSPTQLAAFRAKYQVPTGTLICGPYGGSLDNQLGNLNLLSPAAPLADGTVPYVLLEQLSYGSAVPWPEGADGVGFGLSRCFPEQFANDPANWIASPPTPGRANLLQSGPTILQQPFGQLALASQTIRLTVVAAPGAAGYQWRCNGTNMPAATNATLVLSNAQPAQSGEYRVVVRGTNGATTSVPAYVWIGPDNDRDGVDDDWELDHGFNPYNAGDAVTDADGDGQSNRSEYLAGTDPRDQQSYLRIDQVETDQGAVLHFRAAGYRTYTIQYADSLNPTVWKKLVDLGNEAVDHAVTARDLAGGAGRYYRLVTPRQP